MSFSRVISVGALALPALLSATPEKPNFQDDVLPIFEQSCNSCHNPDRARGGLDLTSMNAILAGGSSGDSVVPGDGAASYLWKLIAHVEKPYMPREKDKLPQAQIDLVKKWIDLGLLPTATGKPIEKKKSSLNLALGDVPTGKPDGPPPMPQYLPLEPSVVTARPAALSAMAANPWSPLVALSGQKQVLLYDADKRALLGILPFEEGFIESLNFSRNGLLLLAGGGIGGKSGQVAAWDVKTGRRLLTLGKEYDTILASDLSADQSLLAIGGPSKRVKVFDVASGEILHNLKKHSGWVTAAAFSPDGVLLATGDRNGGLHVWEAQSGNLFYTLDGHRREITDLSWRADSNLLASVSEEGSARTWEMFNGRQVRTWTAHAGGALSVHFDNKGNLVTSGRDRTVKLWKGDGAAIRTLSGFPEMVTEARYVHDGSRVVAGDWTGAVSVWNVADGKKLGDLSANPPALANRLAAAQKLAGERQTAAEQAKAAHAPLKQKLDAANAALAQAKTVATQAQAALTAAQATLKAAQDALAAATSARDQAAKDKADKQTARGQKTKTLADTRAAQKNHETQGGTWAKRADFRTEQVSFLRETLRKAKEALAGTPDDAAFREAVAKQEQALAAMDAAFGQARDKTAAHRTQAAEHAKQAAAQTTALAAAEAALKAADTLLAQREKTRTDKDAAAKTATADVAAKTQAKTTADAALAQKTKEQTAAAAAEKAPAEALRSAEAQLASARSSVSKWQAETLNLTRHAELAALGELEGELNGLNAIADEAKGLHDAALGALAAAKEALAQVPARIQAKEQTLAQRRAAMTSENQTLENAKKGAADKQGFLNQVNGLANAANAKAAAETANAELAAAKTKFAETLALLQKDLENAQAGVNAQNAKLQAAQNAVTQAQAELDQTKTLTETAPKLVAEKQAATQASQTKFDEAAKNRDAFKTQVDAQKAKAEALLKQYLEALPK